MLWHQLEQRQSTGAEGSSTPRALVAKASELADLADDIADRLEHVFPTLSRSQTEWTRTPDQRALAEAVDVIEAAITGGRRLVRSYLFTSDASVDVEALREEDMLIQLDKGRDAARLLAEELTKRKP